MNIEIIIAEYKVWKEYAFLCSFSLIDVSISGEFFVLFFFFALGIDHFVCVYNAPNTHTYHIYG